MKKIKVTLARKRTYNILIGYKVLSKVGSLAKESGLGKDAVVITNPAIHSLHYRRLSNGLASKGINIIVLKIPDRESSKSYRQVIDLIESIVRIDRGRGIFIIAFGGGVVGDVAGFVASIYKRGIPYFQVPTTLLAQVDSAIGGKVAIDLITAKNMVGAFYQPQAVLSDIDILNTLPARQIRSGIAEIIKYGIIEDNRLFEFLEKNIDRVLLLNKDCLEYVIYRSSLIKTRIIKNDEYDTKGIRAKLNLGHTLGHAIEAASGYSKLYSHGEAVAIGIIIASELAKELGLLKTSDLGRITTLIKRAGLPIRLSKRLSLDRIMRASLFDKKRLHGVNRFVLPTKIGGVRLYENIPRKLIFKVIQRYR